MDSFVGLESSDAKCKCTGETVMVFLLSLVLVILAVCIFVLFVLPLFALGKLPTVEAIGLYVSNLNITNGKLKGNWDSQFTFYEPNRALSVKIKHVDGTLFYRKREALSAASIVKSFHLLPGKNIVVPLAFETKEEETARAPLIRNEVLEEMLGDLAKGVVSFNVKMDVVARYSFWPLFWDASLDIDCENLEVEFAPKSWSGRMVRSGECSISRKHVFK